MPDNHQSDSSEVRLQKFSQYVGNTVTFCTDLTSWLNPINLREDQREAGEVVMLYVRNATEHLDAIQILLANSAIEASRVHLRTLFEVEVSIRFLLEKDSKNRARAFWVFKLHEEIDSIKALLGLKSQVLKSKADYDRLITPVDEIEARARETHKQYLAQLNSPRLRDAERAYKKKLAERRNFQWYSLSTKYNTFAELARGFTGKVRYQLDYAPWNAHVHGSELVQNRVDSAEKHLRILPLRQPKGASRVTLNALRAAHLISECAVKALRPDKLPVLKAWEKEFIEPTAEMLSREMQVDEDY